MYFVAPDQKIYDDGQGMQSWPAYGIDEYQGRYELDAESAAMLTQKWQEEQAQEVRSRFPLGDAIARVTKAVGIQPCAPCQQRQAMLNKFGDRIAGYWRR